MTPPPPNPVVAPPRKSGMSAIVIILIVIGASCPVIGILAAIAIPNFIRFQSRSKQTECKTNLRMINTAQRSYQSDKGKFAVTFEELGTAPEAGNRYTYFLTETSVKPADTTRAPNALSATFALASLKGHGIKVGTTDTTFTAACVGNVDNDATQDIWTVSNVDRTSADGQPIPAGMPFNDVNDITD